MIAQALQHAKFRRPLSDCISLSVTFLRLTKSEIIDLHFSSFSGGKRASESKVPNSIPAKLIFVEGPQVFSGALGIPR